MGCGPLVRPSPRTPAARRAPGQRCPGAGPGNPEVVAAAAPPGSPDRPCRAVPGLRATARWGCGPAGPTCVRPDLCPSPPAPSRPQSPSKQAAGSHLKGGGRDPKWRDGRSPGCFQDPPTIRRGPQGHPRPTLAAWENTVPPQVTTLNINPGLGAPRGSGRSARTPQRSRVQPPSSAPPPAYLCLLGRIRSQKESALTQCVCVCVCFVLAGRKIG